VPTLAPEEMLLALAAHGSKHCWDRLSWVCDLAEFISSQPQTDWAAVLERATAAGRRRRLLWGLLLARDLLGLPLPSEAAAAAAADPRLPRLVAQARPLIFWTRREPFGNVEQWATQLRSMERLRDRLLFCLRLLAEGFRPNKTDRAAVPLPRPLHLLYYAIHPIRIAVTYLPRAVKHLLKGAS